MMGGAQSRKFIASCLSPYIDDDRQAMLVSMFENHEIDWHKVIQMASAELVIPAMYVTMQRKSLLPLMTSDLQEYFHTFYDLNVSRNQAILAQVRQLVESLESRDIQIVLLKGVASIVSGLYTDIGERVMRDIDTLVAQQDIPAAVKQLFTDGYYYCDTDSLPIQANDANQDPEHLLDVSGLGYMHHVHPLCHPEAVASVDLHRQPILQTASLALITTQEAITQSGCSTSTGFRTLSVEHKLLHNFYHNQIQDRDGFYGKFDLMQLYEFVLLNYRYSDDIDWDVIYQKLNACHLRHWFDVYLNLATTYFGCPVPDQQKLSMRSRLLVSRHHVLARSRFIRAINHVVLFVTLKLVRDLSPARVRGKYPAASLVIAYLKHILSLPLRIFRSGWIKSTWDQLVAVIRE